MKRYKHLAWIWVAVMGVLLLAFAIPARVLAHGPSKGGANTDAIDGLFNITLWIAIPVFLLVEGLIIYAIIRYRRRSASEDPEQVHGNTSLEITWTILSFVIVAVLFALTVRALQTDYEVDAQNEDNEPDYTVEVTGYMFNWDYRYYYGDGTSPTDDTKVIKTRYLTLPAEEAVLLKITSTDVQHSFWVPDLAGKVDAIPGYVNTMWLQIDDGFIGETVPGNCAEYCGTLHYNMLIDVNVLSSDDFAAWLASEESQVGAPIGTDLETPLPMGDFERGEQVFTANACSACHAPEDQVAGPGLNRIMRDANTHEGYTVEEHLRESILDPCAYLTEGWDVCSMPQNYGEKLTAQELADLIEYLKEY